MRDHSISPAAPVASFLKNKSMIFALVKRDIAGRYKGSTMGLLWSILTPILMLIVYTFVFSVVFKARWGDGGESKTEFALILFAGLIIFNFFSECLSKAPNLILSNANYVKKIVFPLEILPWVTIGAAFFNMTISFTVWLIAYFIFHGTFHSSIIFLPLIILPLIFLTLGITWALSSLCVYLRDITQFISIAITVLMFLSPIFYPASALPEKYQALLKINPLTPIIEQTREALFWGAAPSLKEFTAYLLVSIFFSWLGFAWFQKTRKGFSDVI